MKRRKFTSGWHTYTDPGVGGPVTPLPPERATDDFEDARNGRARPPWAARNGMPEPVPYTSGDRPREAEVAAIVAKAKRRADAAPGALPRCQACGLPAAECAETECRTRCPEHGVLLSRTFTGLLVCSTWRRSCDYEVRLP